MRYILVTIVFVLAWSLAVVAVVLAEAIWFPQPNIERGSFASIEDHLVGKLREASDDRRLGSASLVLLDRGEIAAKHSIGIADVETRAPVETGKTLYQMASVSKAVTAWGVMKLVEEGKVNLDEPVVRYLSRWRFPGSETYRDKITIRHLLTHTAGLDEGTALRGFLPGERVQTLEEALGGAGNAAGGVTAASEPGTRMTYGNVNYAILQLLIEEVTGQPFAAYMDEAVLRPLGMEKSSFDIDRLAAEGRDRDIAPNFDGSLNLHPRRRYTATAAVALYSTADDIARFARAFSSENAVLARDTVKQMMTPQPGTGGTWGLGRTLFAEIDSGEFVVGHDGGAFPAWGSMVRTNPKTGNGFVLLVSGSRGAVNRLAHDWVYWETGKITYEGRRQLFYDRLFKGAGLIAIAVGTLAIVLWRCRRRWSLRVK